jgi:hypothetical protein
MAYRPAERPLLKLARVTQSSEVWYTVQGLEVLLEQGYAQFSLWTDRRAPREIVARKVWKKYLRYTEWDRYPAALHNYTVSINNYCRFKMGNLPAVP